MEQRREFFASLEGIRGYAFLLVFLIHYTAVAVRPTNLYLYPFFLLNHTAWFLVPIFFVLSGFLITRILLNTQDRDGYFRVFYFRRAIRVLPLYYLTLFVLAAIVAVQHWQFHRGWILYLVYLENFKFSALQNEGHFNTAHLWSLALEEQFYLIWPVIIWFLRSEKTILRFCYSFVGASFALRLAWPLFNIPYNMAYFYSFTRADAIILGAILAIHYQRRTHWKQTISLAKVFVPFTWLAIVVVVLIRGNGLTTDYLGVAAMIPAQNFLGLGFVILALEPGTVVHRLCSKNLICRVGRLSYGLYIFHLLYGNYFYVTVTAQAATYMPFWIAKTISTSLALATTFALAILAYRFIEEPAMRWKDKVKYGERKVLIRGNSAKPLTSELELAG
jgi:peptidoglycan/LPS O-acetylase OafA/YrhL